MGGNDRIRIEDLRERDLTTSALAIVGFLIGLGVGAGSMFLLTRLMG